MNIDNVLDLWRQRDHATSSHPSPASASCIAELLKRRSPAWQERVELSDFQDTQPSMHDTDWGEQDVNNQ